MQERYMMAVLNLKIARNKCPPHIKDPNKTEFKIGDMVLLKNHTPTEAFDSKYKPSFKICKIVSVKAFDVQEQGKKMSIYTTFTTIKSY